MGRYLKQKLADLLLCSAVSVSLIPVICSGFVLTDPWSQSMVVILIASLLLQLVFTLLSRRRAAIRLGIAAGAVLAAAVFAWMRAENPLAGGGDSTFIFLLIQLLTPLLVFLLARSRAGCAVLFAAGVWICGLFRFLQYPEPDWCLFLFLGGAAALFFLRVYTVCAERAELGRVRAGGYAVQTVVICAAALAAAVGIYAGVIAPLDPATRELKLISELRSMELMQVLGISGTEIILDPDLTADVPPEETETEQEDRPEEPELPEKEPEPSQSLMQSVSDALTQTADAIRYDETVRSRLWLLLLIPAAVIAAYVLRWLDRRRWRRRVRALSGESAVVNYYHFFLSRFRRMGLTRGSGQTLREYALSHAAQMEPFDECGVSFQRLTGVYEAVVYGRHPVDEEELRDFERFYDGFYPALRRELGTLKYCAKAFRY